MSKFFKAISTGLVIMMAMMLSPRMQAQRVALKTNTLDWVALSPNLAVEARLSRHLSLQLAIASNPLSVSVFDTRLTNFRVEPELRYWFNRPMARHFMALSLTAATFNLRHADRYFVGDAVGAGLSYGYALVLSNHWNMEAEIGVGVAHFSAFNYRGSDDNRPDSKNFSRFLPVPIRLGLSFSYIFK